MKTSKQTTATKTSLTNVWTMYTFEIKIARTKENINTSRFHIKLPKSKRFNLFTLSLFLTHARVYMLF